MNSISWINKLDSVFRLLSPIDICVTAGDFIVLKNGTIYFIEEVLHLINKINVLPVGDGEPRIISVSEIERLATEREVEEILKGCIDYETR